MKETIHAPSTDCTTRELVLVASVTQLRQRDTSIISLMIFSCHAWRLYIQVFSEAVSTACTTHGHVLRCAFDEIRFKWKAAEESSAETEPSEGLEQALWVVAVLIASGTVIGSFKAKKTEEGEAED